MSKEFKTPKFDGKRFDDHSIPIEVLPEIAIYVELIKDIAKEICLTEMDRQRVPQGFYDKFNVNLKNVNPGSAAPVLERLNFDESQPDEFDRAAIELPERLQKFSDGDKSQFSPKALLLLKRFGGTLHQDEQIIFTGKNNTPDYKYDVKNRAKVIGVIEPARSEKPIKIFGTFNGYMVEPKTFYFKTSTGQSLNLPSNNFEPYIKNATRIDPPLQACIFGVGKFESGIIKEILKVQQVVIIDDEAEYWPKFENRLKTIASFEAKDFPDGDKPTNWKENVLSFLEQYKLIDLINYYPTPYICPNEENGLRLEWEIGHWAINADIYFSTQKATILSWMESEEDDESREKTISLNAFTEALMKEFDEILSEFEVIGGPL